VPQVHVLLSTRRKRQQKARAHQTKRMCPGSQGAATYGQKTKYTTTLNKCVLWIHRAPMHASSVNQSASACCAEACVAGQQSLPLKRCGAAEPAASSPRPLWGARNANATPGARRQGALDPQLLGWRGKTTLPDPYPTMTDW